MPQMSSAPTGRLHVKLGPTFGADRDRVRQGHCSWLTGINSEYEHIVTYEIPLEVVGVALNERTVEFLSGNASKSRGISLGQHIRRALQTPGSVGTGVDALSRSVLQTELDERMLKKAISNQVGETNCFETITEGMLVPRLREELDDADIHRAVDLLKENVQRHERRHIQCLLDPETAIWRELELYWRSVLIGANPQTWGNSPFLDRLAALYTTPSRFTLELLAMLAEDYSTNGTGVGPLVADVVAEARGAEGTLMQFIEKQAVDVNAVTSILRSPTGERYCDLWLAYIVDELRNGRSLADIESVGFHETVNPDDPGASAAPSAETRNLFIQFFRSRVNGPVFELVRVRSGDDYDHEEGFVLERAWFTMNPNASVEEHRLAIRRTLYRRQFLIYINQESGLGNQIADRETAIERVISGTPLADVLPFDNRIPSADRLSVHIKEAHKTTAESLLGPGTTAEKLSRWLNDPSYDSPD